MNEYVSIYDPRVVRIEIVENDEPLVDIRSCREIVVSTKRSSQNPQFFYVRETVRDKLVRAAARLPRDVLFLFEEGLRPLSVQRKIFDDYRAKILAANPQLTESELHNEVIKYVAPPYNTPPHSTGAAIDVSLIKNGQELDMGSTSDETPDENESRGFTHAKNISDNARQNRNILIEALSQEGFANYETEWWHWSYGDRYWAHCMRQDFASYGERVQ